MLIGIRKRFKIVGIIVIALALFGGVFFLLMSKKQGKEIAALKVEDVDMQNVEDGSYTGEVETSLIKVKVAVTVNNHAITKIQIQKHENGKGKPAEAIVSQMIEQNTCDVDTISGATMSSVVIKSAVREALMQGTKK